MPRSASTSPRAHFRTGLLAGGLLVLVACGGPPPPPAATPVDAERLAVLAETGTRLEGPARVLFDWSASEQGARFRGRGVARLEPEYQARLDLFLPNGETAARAALVRGDLRLPPGMGAAYLPPPRLLWASLGVFRPGAGAGLLGGERLDDERVRLRYLYPGGEELHYTLREGRVERAEVLRGGEVVEVVELTLEQGGRYPAAAVYRNLPAFLELRLERDGVEPVESFPPDIWSFGG